MKRALTALAAVALLVATLPPVVAEAATPDPLGQVTEFTDGMRIESSPYILALGPDGNMWFTEPNWVDIGKITPGGVITLYPVSGGEPWGITAGPDGNMWFATGEGPSVSKITTAGVVTTYTADITADSGPWGIAAGPDGNVWFTEPWADQIAKITPAGVVTEYASGISSGGGPRAITAGPDGNLWFTEDAGRVGSITPSGQVTEYQTGISAGARPVSIAAGPDGNMWFTEYSGGIAKVTLTGAITEYTTGISPGANPFGIAAGPDGNVWFTESTGKRIGRITSGGVITEYSTGITRPLWDIAAGPDGNMWFGESWYPAATGAIAKIGTAASNPDANGDGIVDTLQPSGTPLNGFADDTGNGKTTTGQIVSAGGLAISISDATDPSGVTISTGSGSGQAVLTVCATAGNPAGFEIDLPANTTLTLTCGSVTAEVASGGPVVIKLPGGLASVGVDAASAATVDSAGNGAFSIIGVSGAVTLMVNGVTQALTPGEDVVGNSWQFVGFDSPVKNGGAFNATKAGQTIPLKWQVFDAAGKAVTTISSVSLSTQTVSCTTGVPVGVVTQLAGASSDLKNQGKGKYHLNWKTPKDYAGTCQVLRLDIGDGVMHDALFKFQPFARPPSHDYILAVSRWLDLLLGHRF